MGKPFATLVPGIAQRLEAWTRIQDHLERDAAPRLRPTVTISRAFGCEGFPLADDLKRRFEDASGEPWNIYDKALLEHVVSEGNVSRATLEHLGETARRLEHLGVMPAEYYAHSYALKEMAKHVVQLATVGNAIIVGRGGAVLCRGLKNCFHVRLEASFEWRAQTLARRLDLPLDEARAFVRTGTSQRDQFLEEQLRVNPTDAQLFDLVLNNERHAVKDLGAAVFAFVASAWPNPDTFAKR